MSITAKIGERTYSGLDFETLVNMVVNHKLADPPLEIELSAGFIGA
jgi:hypothetical protein